MANGMPDSTQIVYRVSLTAEPQQPPTAPRAGGNAKLVGPVTRYRVLFQIPRDSVSFTTASPGTHQAKLRVDIVAYGRDSKPMNWTGGAMSLSLTDTQFARAQQNGIAAPMEIDLPDAELSLATGIWDLNAQQAGTMQIPMNRRSDAIALPHPSKPRGLPRCGESATLYNRSLLTESQRERISVVLVSPRNPLNIGAVARAMANFGFCATQRGRPL